MTRNFFTCLALIGFCTAAYSQEKSPIEQRISDDICHCFGDYGFVIPDQMVKETLDTCNRKVLTTYLPELEALFSDSKRKDYNEGYRLGKQFYQEKIAPILFIECEPLRKWWSGKEQE